jgi:hypothetical protein
LRSILSETGRGVGGAHAGQAFELFPRDHPELIAVETQTNTRRSVIFIIQGGIAISPRKVEMKEDR